MLQVLGLTSCHAVAFARWHEISTAVRLHDEVDPPILGLERQQAAFDKESSAERRDLFLAMKDESAVGAGEILLRQLDNRHLVDFMSWVPPELRGRGIGSALLDHIQRRARQEQRTTLVVNVVGPHGGDLPGARFLAHRQITLANTMIGRTLRLPVDDARACPELRGTWVTIRGELLATAPTGSVFAAVSGWVCRWRAVTSWGMCL
ncbi:MAG: GNAT family N-acetyltransferase [Actinopolymorphaceae bacterium]